MRIAVDARSVYQDDAVRGIGKSLIGLYRGLAAARPGWRFDLYYQTTNGRPDPLADCPNIVPRRIDGPGDRFGAWLHVWLPLAAWRSGADVLHCHGSTGPAVSPVPLVSTIHDLTPVTHPTGDPNLGTWVRNVRRAARGARRILTPSEAARHDIAARLGVSARRIEVVRWGPTGGYGRVTDPALLRDARARHAVPGPFLLHFGMTLPRKNTARVIDAWARAARPAGAKLLLVGVESAAGVERFRTQAESAGVSDSVAVAGFVPDADISALLSAADGLLYVPLAEGFGVPMLDAFACGTPVLASDRSSVPEVAGGAAVLVDPESVPALADGMAALLNDAGLRDRLRAAGRDRLTHFGWDRAAEQVARVFQQVARR